MVCKRQSQKAQEEDKWEALDFLGGKSYEQASS